ncbi:protein dispatched homolog 1 isoform X2 [Pipistrellus kuhlii]|uniref:Protein dispatched homolog 1 n=1 Tax=Pipistrellus kuhlii TaxID=59472 RepID=A0A7J7TNV6_PIPKU|nr:protein dispatched homolog 1 isoform X2 [Pipistrellus kuhlii]KAF6302476.1 dispatched RND transporter family member 1 [Pipistrellus kuhlii]
MGFEVRPALNSRFPAGPRDRSMAMSNGSSDGVVLSNGSLAASAATPSPLPASDGDLAAQQLTPKEAPRAKASPNGCLPANGTARSSFLPADSQRAAPLLPQCCHPCPYHHPLAGHQECHPEAGPASPSALASCCMQPHSEYSAPLCPHHAPVYQAACCLQPSPPFCLHHPWPDHFQHQPVPQHLASVRPSRPFKLPKSYAALLADWPVVVLGMCTVLIVVCALVGVLVPELPDFSDPLLGFEPRGTTIGQRLVTWNNMVKNTGYKATLANYPFKYADEQARSHRDDRWSDDHYEREKREVDWNFHKDSFFCDVPSDRYSRVVFTSAGGETLWNLPAIKSMCNVDNSRIRAHPQFSDLCQRTTAASCCPSWTLGNYIAILNNRSSCQKIVERDVAHTLKLLRACAKHYQNGTLEPDCWDAAARRKDQLKCAHVPRKCAKYNAVYQILHYLVDKDFLAPRPADQPAPALKYSMLFSPTEKGESMMGIYLDNFERWNASDGVTTVAGIEFGIKHSLFQDYLLMDTVYPAIAIVIVLLVMCVYTRSVFITLMTMFAVISSLIVAYFLYRVVFNFEFFPFMNLTALVILVGIGADDAFVLCDVWNHTKCDKPRADTAEAVGATLQHAALSMFVTSFTTAAAFYANYVSNITAIRCFGVYAGTAILVNYLLMVTWLPAVVVLHERYLLNALPCSRGPRPRAHPDKGCWAAARRAARRALLAASEASRVFFEKVLPCLVIKFRYLWLLWFLALTVGGAYVVCVNPKMKLPSLELAEFQVFRASHPFERYDAEHKKLFMFERVRHGEELHMPITVVWGVSPEDNGNPLNPKSKGRLTLDSSFNMASPASQVWILRFCQKLRNQTFFHQTDEQDFTSCFIETFKRWMENQDCDEPALYPCCSRWSFPYKQEVFELCIKRAIMELERSTGYHLDSKTPGPRFDINDTIRAVVLEFPSTYLFTLAYEKMHQFYREVDAWISRELSSAPEGLGNGWFVSNLEFYDLQDSLSDGTLVAMGLSVAVAFSVMLLTTWNVIISLYAIVSIAGTIFVTVGSLVLLGWELNVLESVTISVAVGLSVDFAVHYGVAYRLAPDADREGKVVFSLSRMGSAIAMAALTTFVAGAMMMPSTVLAYTQLGTFMMLIMCVSWAFATFFFQCLCRCLGPQGACGQIPLPRRLRCGAFSRRRLPASPPDKGPSKAHGLGAYQAGPRGQNPGSSEQEFYELEPLASSPPSGPASEKAAYEDTHVCPEFLTGPAKSAGVPVPAAYPGEPGQGARSEPSPALLQPALHFLSLSQRCGCPGAYRRLQYGPPPCQQVGDGLCHQCARAAAAAAAGSFVHMQNGVAPLPPMAHPVPHVHHCPCLQGRAPPPRGCCLQPGQHTQAQDTTGRASGHSRQGLEVAELAALVRRSAGSSPKAGDPEDSQRGPGPQGDAGTAAGGPGAEDRESGSLGQPDGADRGAEPPSPQTGVPVNSEHLHPNEPAFLPNRLAGEAGCGARPPGAQGCGRAARARCGAAHCRVPAFEAAAPAALAHAELSGESLLIKTL